MRTGLKILPRPLAAWSSEHSHWDHPPQSKRSMILRIWRTNGFILGLLDSRERNMFHHFFLEIKNDIDLIDSLIWMSKKEMAERGSSVPQAFRRAKTMCLQQELLQNRPDESTSYLQHGSSKNIGICQAKLSLSILQFEITLTSTVKLCETQWSLKEILSNPVKSNEIVRNLSDAFSSPAFGPQPWVSAVPIHAWVLPLMPNWLQKKSGRSFGSGR